MTTMAYVTNSSYLVIIVRKQDKWIRSGRFCSGKGSAIAQSTIEMRARLFIAVSKLSTLTINFALGTYV